MKRDVAQESYNELTLDKNMKNPLLDNADLLVDLAEQMSDQQPYEAYVLLKLAQSERPKGRRIRKLLERTKPTPRTNTVVAWRHDGLCERLAAILVGYFSAKALDLDFRFLWPDNSFLNSYFQIQNGMWHDLPEVLTDILSERFCSAHMIEESDLLHPSGEFTFRHRLSKRLTLNSFDKLQSLQDVIRPFWVASNRSYADLEAEYEQSEFRDFMLNEVLSSEIRLEVQNTLALPLPGKRVALHVRGGDIIYGATRLFHGFGRSKSISLPVAEKICELYTSKGYTVVVFGATRSDLIRLSEKYPNVIVFSELCRSDLSGPGQVLCDVFAMSDCEFIISSEHSAVTRLASMLGEAMFIPVNAIFSEDDERQILEARTSEGGMADLPQLQRAFSFWCLFATSNGDTNLQKRHSYIQNALENDPENKRYMIYAVLLETISGRYEDAETRLGILIQNSSQVPEHGSIIEILATINLPVSNELIYPLLTAIETSPNVPAALRRLFEPAFKQIGPKTGRRKKETRGESASSSGLLQDTRLEIYSHLRRLGCSDFKTIIEVGANIGQDTRRLLASAPGAQLYAFEPDAHAARAFVRNITSPRVELFRSAVSANSGTAGFFPSDKRGDQRWDQSGSLRRPKGHIQKYPDVTFSKEIEVSTVSLDEWAAENRIDEADLVWADTQGAEVDLVRGGTKTLNATRLLFIEYSDEVLYEGQISLQELLALLPNFRVVHDFKGDVLLENTLL